jgi:chemotaxis protein methyltransferase CheR
MLLVKDNICDQLESFITQQCGLYFKDYDLKNLRKAIGERLVVCGLDSEEEYYSYLTTSQYKEKEFRELLNLLTIQHTYFFRNQPHFKVLKEKILPEIIERKRKASTEKPSIRIWSAGCSTGQEPYSIAMVVSDIIENLQQWDIQILATDASSDALNFAKTGIYDQNSIKLVDEIYRKKYFKGISDAKTKSYQINDSIKDIVKFSYLNLITDDCPRDLDVIFCRNVMIYFGVDDIKKIIDRFESSLDDSGSLFIGCSESLKYITDNFKMAECEEAIFYRKNHKNTLSADRGATSCSFINTPDNKTGDDTTNLTGERKVVSGANEISDECTEAIVENINRAIQLKEYSKASFLVVQLQKLAPDTIEPYYFSAQIYTNRGEFEKAKEQLCIAIKLEELFVPAYYLLGSICMEEQDLEQAENNFKKAIFLDSDFVLSHLALGTVYKNTGRFQDAIREYQNAIKILSTFTSEDVISYSGGFNAGVLKSICKNSLEIIEDFHETNDI